MLNRGLTLAVVLLETVTGGGGLILLLQAWKNVLNGAYVGAAGNVLGAAFAVIAVWWLVAHHEELKG
jgi:hypothetical protein